MRVAITVIAIMLATSAAAFWFRVVPGRYQLVVSSSGEVVHRLDTATGELTAFVLATQEPSTRITERARYWTVTSSTAP